MNACTEMQYTEMQYTEFGGLAKGVPKKRGMRYVCLVLRNMFGAMNSACACYLGGHREMLRALLSVLSCDRLRWCALPWSGVCFCAIDIHALRSFYRYVYAVEAFP